jgi:hypothetical protein
MFPCLYHEDVQGEWRYNATSRPGRFTSKKNHGTHWTGGRLGPRAGLDVFEKRTISLFLPGFEPRIVQPTALPLYVSNYPPYNNIYKYIIKQMFRITRSTECR